MNLRVWMVSNVPPPIHGVTAFNTGLLREATRAGLDVRVFPVGTRGAIAGVDQPSVAKAASDAAAIAGLASALARRRRTGGTRDVLYFTPSQGGSAVARDLAVVATATLARVPIVAHLHGCGWLDAVADHGAATGAAMRAVLGRCAAVICMGATYARALGAATRATCVGVDNGVELPTAAPSRPPPPAGGPVELAYLSTLARTKGVFAAARAVGVLAARGMPARLRCAGEWYAAAERSEFERMFAAELAARTVELVGFVDEPRKVRLLDEAHFFVLPTRLPEGQPLSLIEAMARGTVPITTAEGGIPDVLDVADRDRLASAHHATAEGLARTIHALTTDGAGYAAASAACLHRQRTHLTMARCAADVFDVLDRHAA